MTLLMHSSSIWNPKKVFVILHDIHTRCRQAKVWFVLFSTDITLTVTNIEKCLVDNVPLHMWEILHKELRIPPRDTSEHSCSLSGVKMWLLFDSNASWQKLAMALYSSTLDGALKQLKVLNFLPLQGMRIYLGDHLHFGFWCVCVQFTLQMRHSLKEIL